jgi:pyruvate carboxylase
VLGGKAPLERAARANCCRPADLPERASGGSQSRPADHRVRARISSHVPEGVRDYAADRAAFGDVSTLPTAVFFYGMQSGQEINIDLERGKTLIVRYVTTSEAHEDGTRTVFFELNGQPRPIRVADRSQVAKRPPQRKVEAGNPKHVGAPMPGTDVTVPVHAGQQLVAARCC